MVIMSKKYKPQWISTPFGHLKYTLVRTKKQASKLGYPTDDLGTANAQVSFYTEPDDSGAAIVYIPKHKNVDLLLVQGLIIHEAVHIWQEVKDLMSESNPSSEFEAYSIQKISQDLLNLLELSNG